MQFDKGRCSHFIYIFSKHYFIFIYIHKKLTEIRVHLNEPYFQAKYGCNCTPEIHTIANTSGLGTLANITVTLFELFFIGSRTVNTTGYINVDFLVRLQVFIKILIVTRLETPH